MDLTKNISIYSENETDFSHNGIFLPDFEDEPIINRVINGRFVFTGVYSLEGKSAEKIKVGAVIKAYTPNKRNQLFRISAIKEKTLTTIRFTANHISFDANRNFIEYMFADRLSVGEIMKKIQSSLSFQQPFTYSADFQDVHQFTIKENYPIDAIIGSNNQAQNLVGVADAELDVDNFEIKLTKRLGKDRGFKIDFGLNLESIVESVSAEQCPNSLYLVGATPEGDYDADKEPITLKYVEPKGVTVTDENRVIGKYTNSECKTKEELKQWAEKELFGKKKVHLPKVSHQVSIIDLASTDEYAELKDLFELQLGDSVYGKLQKQDITIQERMIEYNWYPRIGAYKDMVLGNDIQFYTRTVQEAVETTLKKVEQVQDTAYENLLNASKIITGNDGGHVVHWPKNRPSDILIMDTEDVNTAKQVLRMNKSGIGFSHKGWKGPFDTAWTLDGVFVADFIKAGILSGILVQGVALKTLDNKDFQVVVEGGKVSFERRRVSTGLSDVHGESLGEIEATYGGGKINGFAVKQVPGYIFSINSAVKGNKNISKYVIQIPENSNADNPIINTRGGWTHTGSAKITNEADIHGILTGTVAKFDKLYVGGKEVIPGRGSGGGGTIPPELTTVQEKNAWAVWQYLKSKGYTEQAAAGILGNMQQESGIMPDMEEVGGPGYGLVQWTSPVAMESGREYVQRLLREAGISGDYRNITTQLQLLDWHMHNGQYIPSSAYPYSVDQFKALTDISTATSAFEKNFERPATTHPERIGFAKYWYNKLHGLKPSESTWRNPVRSTYIVTQEWDDPDYWSGGAAGIHGGIDLASIPAGSKPKIYGARIGTVQTVTYDGTGGNYVVVKHSDSYWTYYGHLSSVNVSVGDKITTDTTIGIMGETGGAAGVHLHFEVWKGKEWGRINPRDVINFS